MDITTEQKMYDLFLDILTAVSKLPIVKVDREEFLRKQLQDSPYIEDILKNGPQSVYTLDTLKKKADKVIKSSTNTTSLISFSSGLPANITSMVALGGADVVQYFGFAINMSQKIAYLFGEDELFEGNSSEISEEIKVRIIGYLGVMFGAAGANTLVAKTSRVLGSNLGKQVASKALTKTAWYPLVKKIGAMIGQNITKKTFEKTITKAVPIVGGVFSGGVTYFTFKPMGQRLANVLISNINGEFDEDLVLNPDFLTTLSEVTNLKNDSKDYIDLDPI